MARFETDSYFPEPMWGQKQREAQLDLPSFEVSVISSTLKISAFLLAVHSLNSLIFHWVKTFTHGSSLSSISTLIKLF
jgi:hypothetical protein